MTAPRGKGWFAFDGREGDRTLEQQMQGLEPLFAEVSGKSVLDVGTAEGLIAIEAAKSGADIVCGIDIVERHISAAKELCADFPCVFLVADANEYRPPIIYDIVLMLAVLHKLKDPTRACIRFASAASDLCVIRLPPVSAPVIVDVRSGHKPHDIGAAMTDAGFKLELVTRGAFREYTGYYRRG